MKRVTAASEQKLQPLGPETTCNGGLQWNRLVSMERSTPVQSHTTKRVAKMAKSRTAGFMAESTPQSTGKINSAGIWESWRTRRTNSHLQRLIWDKMVNDRPTDKTCYETAFCRVCVLRHTPSVVRRFSQIGLQQGRNQEFIYSSDKNHSHFLFFFFPWFSHPFMSFIFPLFHFLSVLSPSSPFSHSDSQMTSSGDSGPLIHLGVWGGA